jgi:hypothetical protein
MAENPASDFAPEVESLEASTVSDAVLRDCLERFPHVRLRVTGECMRPALGPEDVVWIARPALHPPRLGDVVLVRHPAGIRLHRLVWGPPLAVVGPWLTKGDRSVLWDGRLSRRDVLGTVVAVETAGASRPPGRGGARAAVGSLLRGLRARLRDGLAGRAA